MTRPILALLLLTGFPLAANAVNVRGRVDFLFQTSSYVPMPKATVKLCYVAGGDCLEPYMTGSDGMYYFDARPGDVIVFVNDVERARVQIPDVPVFDVPAIQGN